MMVELIWKKSTGCGSSFRGGQDAKSLLTRSGVSGEIGLLGSSGTTLVAGIAVGTVFVARTISYERRRGCVTR